MNILWISGRRLGHDLADSTEIGMFEAINKKKGYQVTIMSPGKMIEWKNKHIPLKTLNLPGLITISGAFQIRSKITKILNISRFDVIMVDWRYISLISSVLKKYQIPWFIIDRGPPAKQNWKLRFQKIMWKKAWSIANEDSVAGIIVSKEHDKFIKKYAEINKKNIILHSGTSFIPGKVKSIREGDCINFTYIGQIDKRRDIKSILNLKNELDLHEIKNNICIVGEGDEKRSLQKITNKLENIKILSKRNKLEIKKILDNSHIGIMPMPNAPIWSMASPIKLAEYARHGLLTIGPKHAGNSWDRPVKWEILALEKEWWKRVPMDIKKIISENKWNEYSKCAIKDSEERSWDFISEKILEQIEEYISI